MIDFLLLAVLVHPCCVITGVKAIPEEHVASLQNNRKYFVKLTFDKHIFPHLVFDCILNKNPQDYTPHVSCSHSGIVFKTERKFSNFLHLLISAMEPFKCRD